MPLQEHLARKHPDADPAMLAPQARRSPYRPQQVTLYVSSPRLRGGQPFPGRLLGFALEPAHLKRSTPKVAHSNRLLSCPSVLYESRASRAPEARRIAGPQATHCEKYHGKRATGENRRGQNQENYGGEKRAPAGERAQAGTDRGPQAASTGKATKSERTRDMPGLQVPTGSGPAQVRTLCRKAQELPQEERCRRQGQA